MLIKAIEFPEELLKARESGNLVVFAGAGVSVPAPSSLPLFEGLADQIGNLTGVPRKDREPAERYLGRLKKRGIRVHEAAARILVNRQTKPHELHKLLIRLFPSADRLRVVTTNFDTHFATATQEAFGSAFQTYYAPALPLGGDFSGLVYLHGSAANDPLRCVLTDEDFGRAYLTQAWASRFLAAMFSQYSVLFVGYSHNDTVMNYLTRGLPPVDQRNRFVFTIDEAQELEKWEFLEIRPLIYKLCSGGNPHLAISVSVGEWVAENNRGLLEKGQRIRSIAESQPPLEGEDSDYIKSSLFESATAQIFFKWARLPEWISWLEKHQFVQPLFKPHGELRDFHRSLAHWLTENFFTDHAQEFLALIQRNGGTMHSQLGWFVWRRLCMREGDTSVGPVFAGWVGLLLSQPHDILPRDDWSQLLAHCRFPEDKVVFILLFESLARPRIIIEGNWLALTREDGSRRAAFALNLFGNVDHRLSEAWKKLIKPNLPAYAAQLEPIVLRSFMAGHALLQVYAPGADDYDPFYWHRQSIAYPNANGFESMVDLLVDVARDILCLFLETQPLQAEALIKRGLESGIPVLQRLAIFGFGRRADVSADEKLRWLLQNHFIYRFKTDVFECLQRSYGSASDELKRELIARGMEGPAREKFVRLEERTINYEIYNLFVWLGRIAPECPLTKDAVKILRERNPDFEERDHPELDYWSGGVHSVDSVGGLNVDQVEAQQPEQFLAEVLAWEPRHPLDRSRASYCSAVSSVVTKNPEWGISWVLVLLARRLTDADLWCCVCQGWRNANLKPEQWLRILDVVEVIDAPPEFFRSFIEVLEHGSRREQSTLRDDHMEQAQRVAERIWTLALASSPAIQTPSHKDWLATAINEPGGRLAEFWLQRISAARRLAGDSWAGFPPTIARCLVTMLESESGAAAAARIVFASQLHYFFSLDAGFAQEKVLLLFDWKTDALRAEQCWHGFLFWGRWLPGFVDLLLPLLTEAVNRMAIFPEEVRERLVNHIAGVALFLIQNPLDDNWLPNVLQRIEDKDRQALAEDFDRFLADAAATITEALWERWFRQYWEMRLLGIPKPPLVNEANKMLLWPLAFGKYFPDAVRLAVSLNGLVAFEHSELFHRLQEKGVVRAFPQASGDLVLFFLRTKPKFFHLSDQVKQVWMELKSGGVEKACLSEIREAMLALGCDPEPS